MKKIFPLFLSVMIFPSALFGYTIDFDDTGAVIIEKKGGVAVYKKPDGSIITKYNDREEAVLTDNTVIIKYKNGKREINTPDNVKIIIDYDRTTRYLYPDGRERIISMDGKTPYGLDITDLKEVVRKKNSTVEILYSSLLSDDNATAPMSKFFKELVFQVDNYLYKNSVSFKHMKIVISNCNFCLSGYCRRKNRKEISITAYRNYVKDKDIILDYQEILQKDMHNKLAKKIVNEIFTK